MSTEFNDNVVAEFRAHRGQVGGELAGIPIILIHHIGATTGIERVTPLAYSSQADGRLVIAASNGGSPAHPGWYYNVTAHPTIRVELGTETFIAQAEEVTGSAHAELWSHLIAASPTLGHFQSRTARRIPLFTLARRGGAGGEHREPDSAGGCHRSVPWALNGLDRAGDVHVRGTGSPAISLPG